MSETAFAHEGQCPRCSGEDIEREVIYLTSLQVPGGVVFFCNTCGLTERALTSDREAWYDVHKGWHSPAVPEATYDEFAAKWTKKVGWVNHGDPEPLGPILPRVGTR